MSLEALHRAATLVRRLLARRPSERRALVSAFVVQSVVITTLRSGVVPSWCRPPRWAGGSVDPALAADAVLKTSRLFHGASTCLSRALTVYCLVDRRASPAVLVGVRDARDAGIDAHAWVECDGRQMIGASTGPAHTALARLKGGRWHRA